MCRGLPAPGELPGPVSAPYSHAKCEVRLSGCTRVPLTYRSRVAVLPPPPAESGMEKRTTKVLVAARDVHCTKAPVELSVTARRPDASPARSPIVRLGPTTAAPPPTVPSSA